MNITNIKVDKMRYQKNASAYTLVLFSIALSIIALFQLINFDVFQVSIGAQRVIPDIRIGIEILIGIVMMLTMFLAAEKIKFYDRIWSTMGLFVLAGINFARVFNIPIYAYDKGWIPANVMVTAMIEFAISGALLVVAGIISTRKVILLHHYMKEIK
ncbi:MAG: hypothetical protein IH571_07115 [Acholeplasmataceae bacterium]|nr:hypothetical protein [Acholeplasmataceae bacterium]